MAKNENIFTVEITDTHLKCVYLSLIKEKRSVSRIYASKITNNSDDQIIEQLKEFAKDLPSKKPHVINVIPSNLAIYKNIEIPSIDKKEIKEIIELQAGRHTPYSKDEIIMDYLDVGIFHERYTKILLVIVKKDAVARRYDIIKKAAFKADQAVLSCEGIARWCPQFYPNRPPDKPMGIVHLDHATMDFNVSHHDKSIYIRSVPIDITQFSQQPQELKKKLLEEIKRSLDSYQAENIEASPSKLYFSGATDCILPLIDEFRNALGMDVEVFQYLTVAPMPKEVESEAKKYTDVSFLTAIATSFVHDQLTLTLVPEDVRIGREIKQKAHEVMSIGILSMAILIIFCSLLLTNVLFKKIYLNKLLSSYTKETEEAQALKDLSDRTGIIKKFLSKKGGALFVLVELYNATPKEVFLSSISFQDGETIVFTGTADSMSRVFSLVTDLENNQYFKNVKVDFTKSRRIEGKEVADFGLTLSLEEAW